MENALQRVIIVDVEPTGLGVANGGPIIEVGAAWRPWPDLLGEIPADCRLPRALGDARLAARVWLALGEMSG